MDGPPVRPGGEKSIETGQVLYDDGTGPTQNPVGRETDILPRSGCPINAERIDTDRPDTRVDEGPRGVRREIGMS